MTEDHVVHLEQLRSLLLRPRVWEEHGIDVFNMYTFVDRYYSCGTSACAVGLAEACVIAGGMAPEDDGLYYRYSTRAFGIDGIRWSWCFSSSWAAFDNTPEGAAARIAYLLDRGTVPGWFDDFEDDTAYDKYSGVYRETITPYLGVAHA